MAEPLAHEALQAKQTALSVDFPDTTRLRVHRSISWIGRAEADANDLDARFLFLWIAFNAAYAEELESPEGAPAERRVFAAFFAKLVALDDAQRIYGALWKSFSGPIRVLLENRYVFGPFWRHYNGSPGFEDWQERFTRSARIISKLLAQQDTARILEFVFDRLYILRNQLVHGGTTWNSSVNRDQVRDGAAILGFLVPVFVDIMMDNPQEDWGRPLYPVVD